MADLRTALRTYFDGAAPPLTSEEILNREGAPPEPMRPDHRPLGVLALAMIVTLVGVGGWLLGTDVFGSDGRRALPGSTADDYRVSGIEWLGFEFAYPGEGTTLELIDTVTLIEGSRPYPEYTLLEFAGVDDRGYVGALWISFQSGHGSVVRDALVVGHAQLRPNLQLGCTAPAADGVSRHPAAVLHTPDGRSALRAWYVDVAVLTIEEIDPTLVTCRP